MKKIISAGTTGKIEEVCFRNSWTDQLAGGLAYSAVTYSYVVNGAATSGVAYDQAAASMTAGTWTSGGFVNVKDSSGNPTNVYQFGVPDAALAGGDGIDGVRFTLSAGGGFIDVELEYEFTGTIAAGLESGGGNIVFAGIRPVTIAIQDADSNPLSGIKCTIIQAPFAQTQESNGSGIVTTDGVTLPALNDGTYALGIASDTLAYIGQTLQITVSEDATSFAVQLAATVIEQPTDPALCAVTFAAFSGGTSLEGVVFTAAMTAAPSGSGNVYLHETETATADGSNFVAFDGDSCLAQGARYTVTNSKTSTSFQFIVPAASTFSPANVSI